MRKLALACLISLVGAGSASAGCYDVFGCTNASRFRMDDLMSGPNCEFLYTMRNGTPEQAQVVRDALLNGQREQLPAVLAAVRDCGALDYAHSIATREAAAAQALLADLPTSPALDALNILTTMAVQRDR